MSTIGIAGAHLVTNTGSTSSVQGVNRLQDSDSSSASVLDAIGSSSSTSSSAASVDISKGAQFFQKLQSLKTSDPEKYKATLTEAASKLRDAANSATGDDAKFLNTLADKFDKAAAGDDTALQPPKPPQGFGGQGGQNPTALYSQQGGSNTQAFSHLSTGGGQGHSHPQLSDSTKQTLDSIFSLVDDATTSSSSSSTSTTSTATKTDA